MEISQLKVMKLWPDEKNILLNYQEQKWVAAQKKASLKFMKRKKLILLKQKWQWPFKKTKLGKAGHDAISPGMITYMSKEGKMMISSNTKLGWKYKKMPQDWRTSVTVPIFMKEATAYARKIYATTSAAKLRHKVKQQLGGESQCSLCLNRHTHSP